ncbi:MAG: tryptophan repressor-binding protein [Gammaproteobacteria bacterium]|nr:tryptophan repressor-binding protein [Gammaproteobacteria bacterium]
MHQKYLLILFYSATGAVKNLAHAIADGAEKKGLEVKIRTVPKVSTVTELSEPKIPDKGEIYCTKDDLINCSGLAIGSPTRFGSMAAPLKYFLDSTGDIWSNNELENKLGSAFTSTGSQHGGQEITLFNLMTFMLHQGMIFIGTPYSIAELNSTKSGGTPYGPSHVSNDNQSGDLSSDERKIAMASGSRMAELILALNLNES